MRLRPSGTSGPVASRLDGFERYYLEEAWTWEHMALTRARVVAATSPGIDDRVTDVVCRALSKQRDPDRLLIDVADMRLRMAREHKGESRWDVKHHRGGLVDIEFIAQYLQLLHASSQPAVFGENTAELLRRMGEAGVVEAASVDTLAGALDLWWRLQDALRVMATDRFGEDTASASLKAALARAASQPDFEALCDAMASTYDTVQAIYRDIVDRPAEAARKRLPQTRED